MYTPPYAWRPAGRRSTNDFSVRMAPLINADDNLFNGGFARSRPACEQRNMRGQTGFHRPSLLWRGLNPCMCHQRIDVIVEVAFITDRPHGQQFPDAHGDASFRLGGQIAENLILVQLQLSIL